MTHSFDQGIDGAGFINTISADPFNPGRFVAGGDVSGTHRTSNYGDKWVNAAGGIVSGEKQTASVAHSTVHVGVVYSCTDSGFFMSTDGGLNWTKQSGSPVIFNGGNNGTLISGLPSTHPRSTGRLIVLDEAAGGAGPDYIYVATLQSGVFRSTDQGQNWTCIANAPIVGTRSYYARTLVQGTTNPDTLFMGCYDTGQTNGNVWKITNARTAPAVSSGSGANSSRLTTAPAKCEELFFVGTTLYGAFNSAGIYKSTDQGATWTAVNTGIDLTVSLWTSVIGYVSGGQDIVYVGCENPFGSGGVYRNIMKSVNGGTSWTAVTLNDSASTLHTTMGSSTEDWWFLTDNPSLGLGKGSYTVAQMVFGLNRDSTTGVVTVDTTTILVVGRSGVWRTRNATAADIDWYPVIKNMGATINRGVAAISAAKAAVVNTDWVTMGTTDHFKTLDENRPTGYDTGYAIDHDSLMTFVAQGERDDSSTSVGVTATGDGVTMTYTAASTHGGLLPGRTVTISGMSIAGYNGTKTIATVTSTTVFTVLGATTGSGTGGTASYTMPWGGDIFSNADPSVSGAGNTTWTDEGLSGSFTHGTGPAGMRVIGTCVSRDSGGTNVVILAAVEQGGIWRKQLTGTTPNTGTWTQVAGPTTVLGIQNSKMAKMSWKGGARAYVYDKPTGIWRLDTYGTTAVKFWAAGTLGLPTTDKESEGYVAHDPTSTSRLFVTTSSAVYKITNANSGIVHDGVAAGSAVLTEITGPITKPGPIVVAADGSVYVCQRAVTGGIAKLYKSTDQGATWVIVSDTYYDRNGGSVFDIDVASDDTVYVSANGMGLLVGTPPPNDPPAVVRPVLVTPTVISIGATAGTEDYDTDTADAATKLAGLSNTQDYEIRLPNRKFLGKIEISGGRNINIIGGWMRPGRKTNGTQPAEGTQSNGMCCIRVQGGPAGGRIVHTEGILIDQVDGETQCDAFQCNSTVTTMQTLNCRVVNLQGHFDFRHADVIQAAGGYKEWHIEGSTFSSHYDTIYLRRENVPLGPEMGPLFINKTNVFGYGTNPLSASNDKTFYAVALGLQPSTGPSDNTSEENCSLTQPVWLNEFYAVPGSGRAFGDFVYPKASMTISCKAQVDGTGDYVDWPSWRSNTSPPTGSHVYGVVQQGPPPGGDYALEAETGLNYVDFWANTAPPPPPPPEGPNVIVPRRWRKNNLPVYYRQFAPSWAVSVNDRWTVADAQQMGADFEMVMPHWQIIGTGTTASNVIDAVHAGALAAGHECAVQIYVNGTYLEKLRAPLDDTHSLPKPAYTRAFGDQTQYLADNFDTYQGAPWAPEYYKIGGPGNSLLDETVDRLLKSSGTLPDGIFCDQLGIGIITATFNKRAGGHNPVDYQLSAGNKISDVPLDPMTDVDFNSSNVEQTRWTSFTAHLGAFLRGTIGPNVTDLTQAPISITVNGGSSGSRYFGTPSMSVLLTAGNGLMFEGWLRGATDAFAVPTSGFEAKLISDVNAILDVQRRGGYAVVWTKIWSTPGGFHAGHSPTGADPTGTGTWPTQSADDDFNDPTVVQWHRLWSAAQMMGTLGQVFGSFRHDAAGGNQRIPKDRWFDHLNSFGRPLDFYGVFTGTIPTDVAGGIVSAKGADGLYKRDFQYGRILINTTNGPITHTLPAGTYLDVDDGSNVSARQFTGTVSVPGLSARMLLQVSEGSVAPVGPTFSIVGTSNVTTTGTLGKLQNTQAPPAGSTPYVSGMWNSPQPYTLFDATGGANPAWISNVPNANYQPWVSGVDPPPDTRDDPPAEAVELGSTTPTYGLVWRGGVIIGQLPATVNWTDAHAAGGTGIRINGGGPSPVAGVPTMTLEYVRMHNVEDGFKPRESVAGSDFLVQHCYFTGLRDDCIEDDDFLPGTISNCLFDGVWAFLSEQNQGAGTITFAPGESPFIFIDQVYVRLALSNSGEVGAGKWFKWQGNAGDDAHTCVITNSVFAVEQMPRVGGWASLDTTASSPASAPIQWGSGNFWLWLGAGAWPGPSVPAGVTLLDSTTGTTASQKWRTVRNQWLTDHGMPSLNTLAANYDPKTVPTPAGTAEIPYP